MCKVCGEHCFGSDAQWDRYSRESRVMQNTKNRIRYKSLAAAYWWRRALPYEVNAVCLFAVLCYAVSPLR